MKDMNTDTYPQATSAIGSVIASKSKMILLIQLQTTKPTRLSNPRYGMNLAPT